MQLTAEVGFGAYRLWAVDETVDLFLGPWVGYSHVWSSTEMPAGTEHTDRRASLAVGAGTGAELRLAQAVSFSAELLARYHHRFLDDSGGNVNHFYGDQASSFKMDGQLVFRWYF